MCLGHFTRNRSCWLWGVATLLLAGCAVTANYVPLAEDGLHDPANPGIKLLQEPGDALSKLPRDAVGHRVDWAKALEQGAIKPHATISADIDTPQTKVNVLNQDVIMPDAGEMAMVLFPHRQHTEWLVCSNCHDQLYKIKAGATPGVNMERILQGESCGSCHGAVAFPLTECSRCHSVVRK